DMQTFVAAFDTLFGGFRQRAEATFSLLQAEGTAFFVVAVPEPAAMREAAYFVERLEADDMPLAGLIVNRVHDESAAGISAADAESAAPRLARGRAAERRTAELLDVHAERMRLAERENRLRDRFSAAHRNVEVVPVPALETDVHDLDGLRRIGDHLGTPQRARAQPAAGTRTLRQLLMCGLRRSRARRSRSVIPPQTPHSMRLSRASARHSARTLHPLHTSLARFCSAPFTNRSSDLPRHAASWAQFSFHMAETFPETSPAPSTGEKVPLLRDSA